jgi:hypothetical protein
MKTIQIPKTLRSVTKFDHNSGSKLITYKFFVELIGIYRIKIIYAVKIYPINNCFDFNYTFAPFLGRPKNRSWHFCTATNISCKKKWVSGDKSKK